jgi:hypothetical protein
MSGEYHCWVTFLDWLSDRINGSRRSSSPPLGPDGNQRTGLMLTLGVVLQGGDPGMCRWDVAGAAVRVP